MLHTLRKLFSLFPPTDRRNAAGLLLLILAGAILEAFCVALIFPVVTILANPESALRAPFVARIHELLGRPEPLSFVFAILCGMLALYVIKNGYAALLSLLQSRFAFARQNMLSQRLFQHYLQQPYALHLQRNTGDMIRNLTHEADRLIWSVLLPSLILVAEGLIALMLVLLLFSVDLIAAGIVAGLFLLLGVGFYRTLRDRIAHWGAQRQHHEGQRIRRIQEGLGGLKEIRILGTADYFLRSFLEHSRGRAKYSSRHILAQGLPLLFLEVLAMGGLLAIAASTILQNKPFDFVLPMLGLFVGASFRLIPAANRILITYQEVRFSGPTIEVLYQELGPWSASEEKRAADLPMPLRNSIRIEHVSYLYPGSSREALSDITLEIPHGVTVGFIGTSGSGKTTLIDLVLGLLPPSAGHILVDGQDIQDRLEGWQSQIGYIPQAIFLADTTIRNNIALGHDVQDIDDDSVWRALALARIDGFVASLPEGLDTPIGENGTRLSGGQRQRIGIARAVFRDPPVLVLDEATAALDGDTEAEVMNAVTSLQGDKTILIVAHRHSTLRNCDLVVRLEEGHIRASGPPEEMLAAGGTEKSDIISTIDPIVT
jgi:ABC-type multidrug transport system fused ATPase/permease subunit